MFLRELLQPVSSIAGVGPAASKNLAKLGVYTVSDLLCYWPRRWDDRRKWFPISAFSQVPHVQTVAKVLSHQWFGFGRMKTLKIEIADSTGRAYLICFNRSFLEQTLPVGAIISVIGNFYLKYQEIQSSSFEAKRLTIGEEQSGCYKLSEDGLPQQTSDFFPGGSVLAFYPLKAGTTQTLLRKTIQNALKTYEKNIQSELPDSVITKRNLLSKVDAIRMIHQPANMEELEKAKNSIMYEELFYFQYSIGLRIFKRRGALAFEKENLSIDCENEFQVDNELSDDISSDNKSPLSPLQKRLLERLSFELTEDQKKVLRQINYDIDKGEVESHFQMSRLLQGDVGSGKTLVAFLAALRIIDMGGQVALVAPTELLARQHAENAAKIIEPLGVELAFLSGNVKTSGRAPLLQALLKGEVKFVIGTHALFSSGVKYKNLKLAIIDEQHRFGVLQRTAIMQKGENPHLLMMSATPIPRTLALTVFGDLDVSVIKTMPPGRKQIITHLATENSEQKVYDFVRRELEKGRQAYFVYPLISGAESSEFEEESENSKSENIKSAEEMFWRLSKEIYPEFNCSMVHSKIEEDQQRKIMQDFQERKTQVLVATTVVEVGVDNPNATCMVIEHADRFGLSALHQLRGRVGRGTEQSYCFLVYGSKLTDDGKARLKIMHEQSDGFVIAEEDLKLRGPGHASGVQQSGYLKLGLSDPVEQKELMMVARQDAFELIKNDCNLEKPENKCIKEILDRAPPFKD